MDGMDERLSDLNFELSIKLTEQEMNLLRLAASRSDAFIAWTATSSPSVPDTKIRQIEIPFLYDLQRPLPAEPRHGEIAEEERRRKSRRKPVGYFLINCVNSLAHWQIITEPESIKEPRGRSRSQSYSQIALLHSHLFLHDQLTFADISGTDSSASQPSQHPQHER